MSNTKLVLLMISGLAIIFALWLSRRPSSNQPKIKNQKIDNSTGYVNPSKPKGTSTMVKTKPSVNSVKAKLIKF